MHRVTRFTIAVLLLPSTLAHSYFPGPSAPEFQIASENITFATLGGFGRIGATSDCLAGKANECYGATDQLKVAWYMDQICGLIECQFIATTGDNFYPSGLSTPEGVKGRMATDWQNVYQTALMSNLQGLSWNIATGNHDHQGDYTAELDLPSLDLRWVQPRPYYVQDVVAQGTSVRLIFLDTVSFVTNLTLLADDAVPGYEALDTSEVRTYQMEFLEMALNTSSAMWNIVIAHHPFYGTTDSYAVEDQNGFLPPLEIMKRYHVPVVISGHDHTLALSEVNNTAFVTSGVGSVCNPADGCTPDPSASDACPTWVRYVSANTSAASCNSGIATLTATQDTLTVELWSFANHTMPVYQVAYDAVFSATSPQESFTTSSVDLVDGAGYLY